MTDKKQVAVWADEFMFRSESHNAAEGPKVHLLAMNADPLGQIAAAAKMYKGEVVRSLSEVTHEERRYYMEQMQKTKLKMPLETVYFHFMLENVSRAFTHQLVRQRTAAYAQESMRFAVVEDMNEAVALPPSLAGFNRKMPDGELYGDKIWREYGHLEPDTEAFARISDRGVKQYLKWRRAVGVVSETYMDLVNTGMPAEDARGLMPTNIITRVNYITNLRSLLDHSGNRLCTQAQMEWRFVFAQIATAIANYRPDGDFYGDGREANAWQYEAISQLFRPVCYQTGKCEFAAEFDRYCSIRARVNANAEIGRPSTEWGVEGYGKSGLRIDPIQPAEWLADPAAARRPKQ